MSWSELKQFDVTRIINWTPYRLHLGTAAEAHALFVLLLEFCRSPRTYDEMSAHLSLHTACPPDRVQALRMTVTTQLYLWGTGGFHKLLDDGFQSGTHTRPSRMWATEQGLAWLEAMQERPA